MGAEIRSGETTVNIAMSNELKEKLKKAVKTGNTSMSQLGRDLFQKYLAEMKAD